ncbi:MAG: 50S ribosomal protein L4 [Candidatus Pacebacteria bacterium]|nr:50S ribosomal protein L4 [Candidatus Paceibacterota bacterium]
MEKITAQIYSVEGKAKGMVELPSEIFGLSWNGDLVHQVVTTMLGNARLGIAHSKDRSEVSGGGKKPWRQKGTGSARHGSKRSPIWRHGGVSHGPRNSKDYSGKINKKTKVKALFVALSRKLRDGQMMFTENLDLSEIKTKHADTFVQSISAIAGFETLATPNPVNMLLVTPVKNEMIEKSFRNLPFATVREVQSLNPLDVVKYRYIVMMSPEDCTAFLSSKINKDTLTVATA